MKNREIWKEVNGYKGLYEISSFGRVKSLGRRRGAGGNKSPIRVLNGNMPEKRTPVQSNALHVYYRLVAEELNNAGYNVQLVLKEKMDIDWDERLVKELLWRNAQKAMTDKESTTELNKTEEIDRIYEHLNRHLSEKFGVHVPFPSDPDKEKELLSGPRLGAHNNLKK